MNFTTDPRSHDWFLLQNPPVGLSLLLISYVTLVRKGPKFMRKREAFDLKHIMLLYNLIQVVINASLAAYVSILVRAL